MLHKILCFFGKHDWEIEWQEEDDHEDPGRGRIIYKTNYLVKCKHCPKKDLLYKEH
jgi:hypothetical protein